MTDQEVKQVHKALPFTIGITKMINCYCGCHIINLNEGDIPIEEYVSLTSQEKNKIKNVQLLKKFK